MSKKLTTKEFIDKSKVIHGDIYDYSNIIYINGRGKINIVCPEHGTFNQRASAHSNGQGCPMCNTMDRRCKLFDVLDEAKLIHNDKYNYSLVKEYKTSNTKIPVICPKHGTFMITSHHHINRKQGCGECKGLGLNGFLDKAHEKHGDKYDYSLIKVYNNNKEKVPIVCKEHGKFIVRVGGHIHGGQGCAECTMVRIRKTTEEFIKDANVVHNNKYTYTRTKYVTNKTKIIITCPEHGDFEQRPDQHLFNKGGCPFSNRRGLTEFINECNVVHENRYDYSLVGYETTRDKIKIKCLTHGVFIQRGSAHLHGQGCPICRESKGERKIRIWLDKNKIKYVQQQTISGCIVERLLRFDFYLPQCNTTIEFQGKQHYKSVKMWGGDSGLKDRQKRDKIKMEYCSKNNIPLLIIKYNDDINLMLSTITTVR